MKKIIIVKAALHKLKKSEFFLSKFSLFFTQMILKVNYTFLLILDDLNFRIDRPQRMITLENLNNFTQLGANLDPI